MKILKIKSLNINSLKGKNEIDFKSFLDDNALFAITGPTGAGKSTILDIITCALYGRTPRLKNPNELMSRHTGECYCEVEFEIKGIVYRSSWSQKRARKSADGKFQGAKMEIVDVVSSKVIKATLRDVPKYVEELSGLDFDRFKQSMVLAQGGFDAFLKADEKERSTLLEKMTGTQIYKEISLDIFARHKEYETDINSHKKILESTELLDSAEVIQKTQELEENKKQKLELDSKEKELLSIKHWITTLATLESDYSKYTELYIQSTEQKEQNKEQFTKLACANKALNIHSLYQEKNTLVKYIQNSTQTLENLQKKKEELKTLLSLKQTQSKQTKELCMKEKVSFEANSIKLKELRVVQTQLQSTQNAQTTLADKIIKQKQELSSVLGIDSESLIDDESLIQKYTIEQTQQIAQLKKEYEAIDTQYKEVVEKLSMVSANEKYYKDEVKNKEELQKSIEQYTTLLADIEKETTISLTLQKEIKSHIEQNKEKQKLIKQIELTLQTLKEKKERELLISKYEDDRVKLKEGQECFLCGATTHPYINHSITIDLDETTKNIKTQETLLSNENESLKKQEIVVSRYSTQLESSQLEIEKRTLEKKSLEEFFDEVKYLLGSYTTVELEEQKKEIEKKLLEIVTLREQKEMIQHKREKAQIAYNEKTQQQIKTQNIIESLSENSKESAQYQKDIKTLENKSKEILDIEDSEKFEKDIQSAFNTLQNNHNTLLKELAEILAKEESLGLQIEELTQKQKEDSEKLQLITKEFEDALLHNGFENTEELEKALLSNEQRESLQLFCKKIEDKYTEYKTLKTNTSKALEEHKSKEIDIIPLDEVTKNLEEIQSKIDLLQMNIGALQQTLKRDAEDRVKNLKKIEELEKKIESFKVWVKLNDMIGSADGAKFAKFAQGITLDQLISLANHHLALLSSRYELQRSSDPKKILEIEVCDSFQGDVIRPVSTLSGGESFIVSLSLALGLSELASQKIAIDSLFLDEGFGTLDEESLETALNALNLLQSRGKMVGVISHVEALKERIPLQIKVEPRGDGTSFVEIG